MVDYRKVVSDTMKDLRGSDMSPQDKMKEASRRYREMKEGKSVKGAMSKTHKGEKDYTTKKSDKDFHEGGKDLRKGRRPFSSTKKLFRGAGLDETSGMESTGSDAVKELMDGGGFFADAFNTLTDIVKVPMKVMGLGGVADVLPKITSHGESVMGHNINLK